VYLRLKPFKDPGVSLNVICILLLDLSFRAEIASSENLILGHVWDTFWVFCIIIPTGKIMPMIKKTRFYITFEV